MGGMHLMATRFLAGMMLTARCPSLWAVVAGRGPQGGVSRGLQKPLPPPLNRK